jgi:hypothetical protein
MTSPLIADEVLTVLDERNWMLGRVLRNKVRTRFPSCSPRELAECVRELVEGGYAEARPVYDEEWNCEVLEYRRSE